MATKPTRRPAAKKPAPPPPPPPPVEEEVEDDDERQTLILEDEKYFVDELSEDAQDIVKLLQHLNPQAEEAKKQYLICLLYTSPSPRDRQKSRMPSSA